MGAGGGCCSTLEASPPAPSARRRLRLFSLLLASRCCGCERGGAERERRGGVAGDLYCTDEGEESGFSIFFLFFFSFDRSGRWPLPACRGGGRRTGELASVLNAESEPRRGRALMRPLRSPQRPAVVHLRWLPLDLSDSASEMGNIVEFTSSCCRSGGVRIPERHPCSWRGGWGNYKASACSPPACWLLVETLIFAVRGFSLRKLNCPATTRAFHTGILKRNLLIRPNSGRCLTQFLTAVCWTDSSQMMNINIDKLNIYTFYIILLVVHTSTFFILTTCSRYPKRRQC